LGEEDEMAQIKHLIYPERYAGNAELVTAIRELQDIQIARSDAAPDQIGPQAAPTPDPERILPSAKYLCSLEIGHEAKTALEYAALNQQTIVEAICQWMESMPTKYVLTAVITSRLRADAARVVREVREEER